MCASNYDVGSETWKPTKPMENKLRSAQRGMDRSMSGISLRDKKRASWIRENTKVKYMLITNRNKSGDGQVM